MIRVVVTGSECTGKTTLARALAANFGVPWVPEYVREFVERKRGRLEFTDVEAIARGQMASEDALAATAPKLLVQDTDLLSSVLYSRHYYGDCPPWIEAAAAQRAGDLYLLAGIDVPWVPDGAQRDRPHEREAMHELFRRGLLERGLRFVEVSGSHERRLASAVAVIEELRRNRAST